MLPRCCAQIGSRMHSRSTTLISTGPVVGLIVGRALAIALSAGLVVGSTSAGIVSFQGLGTNARPNALSADGSTLAGNGIVWHAGSGLSALPFTRGNGISADGSVIVGRNGSRAVRWDGTVIRDLDTFGWGEYSTANAVSGDGSVVVGNGAMNGDFPETNAYRWTPDTGAVVNGSSITGGLYENWGAIAASTDGSVVVGNQGYTPRAYRWTSGTGAVDLFPDLPYSTANGVSSNGSIIAVTIATDSPSDRRAARLVLGSTEELLGELAGGQFSQSNSISGDGLTIVGVSDSFSGNLAFLWHQSGGIRSISSLLTLAGATAHSGWTLTEATAISADGSTIVGLGINASGASESWIVTIPAPSSVAALGGLGLLSMRRRRRAR